MIDVLGRVVPEIPEPDQPAAAAARLAVAAAEGTGPVGRLGDLAAWAAAVQAECPPRGFVRTRLLLCGDADGGPTAAVGALADRCGVTVRLVGVSGQDQAIAFAAGADAVDEEVDSGTDLLVAAVVDAGSIATAAAVVATFSWAEPVAMLGWPTEPMGEAAGGRRVDDEGWMRTVAAVRDTLRRTRPCSADPGAVLAATGDGSLAALTGVLLQAAARRTPVLLDGLEVGAAALIAEELAPGAVWWWVAAQRTPWPAHRTALTRLRLDPLLELGIGRGDGLGALLALPLLDAATDLLRR